MSYINEPFALQDGTSKIIPLDRWSFPAYAVEVDSGTSILVEGTLGRVNRDTAVIWNTLNDVAGSPMAAILPASITGIENNPLEAIRITATGVCVGRVMQTGSE